MGSSYVDGSSEERFFPASAIHREPKTWGEEHWIVNKEYCGKKLLLKKNRRCSMHAHAKKDEVFYVQSGKVLLELGEEEHVLGPGDVVHIPPGFPHRFTGLEESEIMEFSTTHDEADSFRSELSGHVEQERYERQSRLIASFPSLRLLVVGDAMLDRYIRGSVDRISPEAPIPVVHYRSEYAVPGGAANAALNAAALGASVTFIGVVGDDAAGRTLETLLKRGRVRPLLLRDDKRCTIEKQRIVSEGGQQIVRLDFEDAHPLTPSLRKTLRARIEKEVGRSHALLLSDYAKGLFSPDLLSSCVGFARRRKVPVVVDPKPHDASYLSSIRGATVLTPNRREAQALAGTVDAALGDMARMLGKKARTSILLTLGAEGMLLHSRGRLFPLPALAKQVADVSGAGDTVAATLTLALAATSSLSDAADLANRAASIVVTKQGTATVSAEELLQVL